MAVAPRWGCSPSVPYGEMAVPPGTSERRRALLTPAAAFTVVGTIVGLIVLRGVFVAAHRPLSWAVACVAAAVLAGGSVPRS